MGVAVVLGKEEVLGDGVSDPEGDGVDVTVAVAVGVSVPVELGVDAPEGALVLLPVPLGMLVADGDAPIVSDAVGDCDCVVERLVEALGVTLGEEVGERVDVPVVVALAVGLHVGVGDDVRDADNATVAVPLDVPEGDVNNDSVALGEADEDDVALAEGVVDGEPVALGVTVGDGDGDGVGDDERVAGAVAVDVGVTAPEPDGVGVRDGLAPSLKDAVLLADRVLVGVDDIDRVLVGVRVEDGVAVPERVCEPVGVPEALTVLDCVTDDVCDIDRDDERVACGDAESVNAAEIVALNVRTDEKLPKIERDGIVVTAPDALVDEELLTDDAPPSLSVRDALANALGVTPSAAHTSTARKATVIERGGAMVNEEEEGETR